jgi:MEMO1 family protein
MKIRTCTVAGMFYPAGSEVLKRMLSDLFQGIEGSGDAAGVVSPHAGYIYSGKVAAQAFSAIDSHFSGTFVVIGPSHQGFTTCISAIPWETPIGQVEADTKLASYIDLPVDERAMSFGNENSLEVQMPFIRYRFPDARIVPVMMGCQTLSEVDRVSNLIGEALEQYDEPVKIVASSDFSHYVTHEKATHDDGYAIDALTSSMNVPEFLRRILTHRITACGYGPIGCMIQILKKRGASHCDLLKYQTSGEVSGDYNQVVGYAALAVK